MMGKVGEEVWGWGEEGKWGGEKRDILMFRKLNFMLCGSKRSSEKSE